ncbi:MAG: Lrp/AsnC ligand binding domain-containing protein [Nocardioidaceae bacterium]
MATAYVLVQTSSGAVQRVVDEVGRLDQVDSVDPVTGPYDAIVTVEGSVDEVEPVRDKLSEIDNVSKTIICLSGSSAE